MSSFSNKADVFLFVCEMSVLLKKPFVVVRSESRRFVVQCVYGCDFFISFFMQADGTFHIADQRDHSCAELLPIIKKRWVYQKIRVLISERGRLTTSEAKEWFFEMYQINVEKTMLSRVACKVKREMYEENGGFGKLSSFLGMLSGMNEGTRTALVTQNGLFRRVFLALSMCINSFDHTTRIVGLDACHVKASYGGSVLVLTVLDGNGQVFPLALAIAESENQETWSWFLSLVKSSFRMGNGESVVFLSDREKGIDKAVSKYFPAAAHSHCVYHIQKNVKCKFHKDLKGLIFQAARATNEGDFNEVVERICRVDSDAGAYIKKIDKQRWARAFFPCRRCGHVTSNISESMNWWLDEARYHDPLGFFSLYIRKMNVLFEERRSEYMSMRSTCLPKNIQEMFSQSVSDSRSLRVVRHTRYLLEVQRKNHQTRFRTVNLETRMCSCGFYREHGVPCRHMCAAILFVKGHPQDFIAPEHQLESLKRTYVGTTIPVDVNDVEDDGLKPPIETKRRGRPKEKRNKSSAEKGPRRTVTCRLCGGKGHNSRTCKAVFSLIE